MSCLFTVAIPKFSKTQANAALHAAYDLLIKLQLRSEEILQIWNNLNRLVTSRLLCNKLWREQDAGTELEVQISPISPKLFELIDLEVNLLLDHERVSDDDVETLRSAAAIFFCHAIAEAGAEIPVDNGTSGAMSNLLKDALN